MQDEKTSLKQAACQITLGDGSAVEVEFTPPQVWAALGPRVADISVWMKGVMGADVRVEIERQSDGLRISVDQGDNQPAWWPEHRAPTLTLSIAGAGKRASVTAQGPACAEEVLLARSEP